MLKNLRRRVVAITAAALMVTATTAPAFAAGYPFYFTIAAGSGARFDTTAPQTKSYDGDSQWYFTPESGSWNGSVCKTWAYTEYANHPGTPSGYHNVREYGRHAWNYQYTPAGGTSLQCEIKEESPHGYWMSGHWCP